LVRPLAFHMARRRSRFRRFDRTPMDQGCKCEAAALTVRAGPVDSDAPEPDAGLVGLPRKPESGSPVFYSSSSIVLQSDNQTSRRSFDDAEAGSAGAFANDQCAALLLPVSRSLDVAIIWTLNPNPRRAIRVQAEPFARSAGQRDRSVILRPIDRSFGIIFLEDMDPCRRKNRVSVCGSVRHRLLGPR